MSHNVIEVKYCTKWLVLNVGEFGIQKKKFVHSIDGAGSKHEYEITIYRSVIIILKHHAELGE